MSQIIKYIEEFIKDPSEFREIENILKNCGSIGPFIEGMLSIFEILKSKVNTKIEVLSANTARVETLPPEYSQLEKLVQKYEWEIREKIRVEQQLKLYSESLEAQIKTLEQSKSSLEGEISNNQKEMKAMHSKISSLENDFSIQQQEIDSLNRQIKEKSESRNTDPRKRHLSFDHLIKAPNEKKGVRDEKENRILDDFYKNISRLRRPEKSVKNSRGNISERVQVQNVSKSFIDEEKGKSEYNKTHKLISKRLMEISKFQNLE